MQRDHAAGFLGGVEGYADLDALSSQFAVE
jgi:hypothetical protein